MPEDLQGIYFGLWNKRTDETTSIHATVNDPGLLRYASKNLMPVIWSGNIRELNDNTLIAGVYPTYYLDGTDSVSRSCISFYQSTDWGRNWNVRGKILYQLDLNADTGGEKASRAFTEPTFVVLDEKTLFCVMRTGSDSPMYKVVSYDNGASWSIPKAFTPNGVRPTLIKLDNGVLALASGRPGVQLRISLDGQGENWTEPIEMVHYMDRTGHYASAADASCGSGCWA